MRHSRVCVLFSVLTRISIKPGSLPAYAFACRYVAIAVVARLLPGYAGVTLPYATFSPAILFAAVVAGCAAGITATVCSLLIRWWAFYPPHYEFVVPDRLAILDGTLFLLAGGAIVLVALVFRRQHEQLRPQEEARNVLMNELAHRGRNSLGVVNAIVRNSVKDSEEADALIGRITALAKTNELLTGSGGKALPFADLLKIETEPYGRERILIDGATFTVEGNEARALNLIFHELMTNAAKYGALRHADGKIKISWKVEDKRVRVNWLECDGPPVVAPARKGFGLKLVIGTIKSLGGDIRAEFHEKGLICEIDFPCTSEARIEYSFFLCPNEGDLVLLEKKSLSLPDAMRHAVELAFEHGAKTKDHIGHFICVYDRNDQQVFRTPFGR
jgi:two-component sensor histidine kinase